MHTSAANVRALYDELQGARGYHMSFANVRVSVDGTFVDVAEAEKTLVYDQMRLSIMGPNRGG